MPSLKKNQQALTKRLIMGDTLYFIVRTPRALVQYGLGIVGAAGDAGQDWLCPGEKGAKKRGEKGDGGLFCEAPGTNRRLVGAVPEKDPRPLFRLLKYVPFVPDPFFPGYQSAPFGFHHRMHECCLAN